MKIYSSKSSKSKEINTVADLKSALREFPDNYPIHMFIDGDDNVFIKSIDDFDDACQIELI